jgi:MFS transporter, PAT family, beta-lactamase induction signal transducer AmpG
LITGLTYAGFTAFVLEAMGLGAAATKYNVYASLSNTPIYYMTRVDGWSHGRWGAGGMLYTEAIFGVLGLSVFLGVAALARARARRGGPGGGSVLLPDDVVQATPLPAEGNGS